MQLQARGEPVTADTVAEAAQVSRRTVFLHFPSLDQLVLDATLGALAAAEVDVGQDAAGSDVRARVQALAQSLIEMSPVTMPLGRQIIRLTVASEPAAPHQPLRGARRVRWIEQALEPIRDQLTELEFDRLVSALAMVLGFEGMVVLQDIRGLDAPAQTGVISWAVTALVDAALASAGHPGGQVSRR